MCLNLEIFIVAELLAIMHLTGKVDKKNALLAQLEAIEGFHDLHETLINFLSKNEKFSFLEFYDLLYNS